MEKLEKFWDACQDNSEAWAKAQQAYEESDTSNLLQIAKELEVDISEAEMAEVYKEGMPMLLSDLEQAAGGGRRPNITETTTPSGLHQQSGHPSFKPNISESMTPSGLHQQFTSENPNRRWRYKR